MVLVTVMPETPDKCCFGVYDCNYDVVECMLSPSQCMECTDVNDCPYLVVASEGELRNAWNFTK